ncbi:helix-turn-helix domain-containing protein [Falsigemmobacter faecalis]|uniref:Plasmid replication protein C N-terminal domain-containing protein n=1 Tax=Falsigemmobacter faecalis TaxID=2488730 RepID=A0A3P3DJQ3_9RHOB|nr:helix-turn-helix domain-containing protein [Falsigemmobacter faecalis]RRH74415.1 hypothetical protein EG244_09995 [Falsigemmobacter faecalis]
MRKINNLQLQAQRLAEEFRGLPPGFSKYDLCDAITAAQGWLGVNQDCISLLIFLIKRTRDEDWMPGRHPLVAWNRFLICHHFDWSDDKLGRVEKDLSEAQLISFVDSSNCKRFMNRNNDGSISDDSAGISLAPCGVRALEIQALAHSVNEEGRALFDTYGEIFAIRGELQRLTALRELPHELVQLAKAKIKELPQRRTRKHALSYLRSMLAVSNEMVKNLNRFLGLENDTQQQPASAEAALPESAPASSSKSVSHAAARCGRDASPAKPRPQYRKFAEHKSPDSNFPKDDSKIIRILEASPDVFKAYLEQEHDRLGQRNWQSSLQKALERYAGDLSLHASLIQRMSALHGYENALQAVLAVGHMSEKGAHISHPAAYAMSVAKQRNRVLQ